LQWAVLEFTDDGVAASTPTAAKDGDSRGHDIDSGASHDIDSASHDRSIPPPCRLLEFPARHVAQHIHLAQQTFFKSSGCTKGYGSSINTYDSSSSSTNSNDSSTNTNDSSTNNNDSGCRGAKRFATSLAELAGTSEDCAINRLCY
jgi:hypothetical protein